MVLDLAVAHAQAGAGLFQHVGRVGHAFHAARDHHLVGAGLEQVVGQHHGFHTGATKLVYGGAAGGARQACVQCSLAGRALFQTSGQHTAHDHFLDVGGLDACAADGFADGYGAQVDGGNAGQAALHAAHGGAGAADDDDFGHEAVPRWSCFEGDSNRRFYRVTGNRQRVILQITLWLDDLVAR
ncbi:hypothetical protein D3C81_1359200 [compost metagenome]